MTEPVADETRSILDGHIILSRKLAAANHYPAIDILASVSRVMGAVTDEQHRADASHMRELLAKHEEVDLLVKIGEYQHGSDPVADEALSKMDAVRNFLRQRTDESTDLETAIGGLQQLS